MCFCVVTASPPCLLPCRVQGLQLHHELHLAHLASPTDLNAGRACRRSWQQALNCQIQHIALQLLVAIFRYLLECSGTCGEGAQSHSAGGALQLRLAG